MIMIHKIMGFAEYEMITVQDIRRLRLKTKKQIKDKLTC